MTTLILDLLHCEEEETHQWDDEEQEVDDTYTYANVNNNININVDDNSHQELSSLVSKQSDQQLYNSLHSTAYSDYRCDAVEWIMGVVSHYAFTALTALLAVNYFDRFFDRFEEMDIGKKPWMTQLVAVACLSIAAKVEETHVPLLLDLQIDGSRYVFEPKTVKKMEILILSTLEWKMNPVTPLSFLSYVTRSLGFKHYLSSEFINRCECVLLCFLHDGRFRCHLPSVIATATMVHVISSVEPCIGTEFQFQILGILGINKDEVEKCLKDIHEVTHCKYPGNRKRKFGSIPRSPDDVTNMSFSSDESLSKANPLLSSSPKPGFDKIRKGAT